MTYAQAEQTVQALDARGFDATIRDTDEDDPSLDATDREYAVRVSCTQCEALVICGTATHEHGCPQARRRDADDDPEDLTMPDNPIQMGR